MRALILLAVLPACTLYDGTGEADDVVDGGGWWPDAGRSPDAGFMDGCDQALPCPDAIAGRASLCGRVLDVETSEGIDLNASLNNCTAGTSSGGCHVWLRFYDALSYAQDPSSATPLVPTNLRYDDCGRFTTTNVPVPASGYVAIVVDDAPGTPDDHRATMMATRVWSGGASTGLNAYSLRRSTDAAWTAQAGLGATTIADRGAVLAEYVRYDGVAPTGVQVTAGGQTDAATDYYFSSADVSTLAPALTATGVNGAALRLDTDLANIGGVGGEELGCDWGYDLADAVPGVLWVLPVQPFCPI